MTDQKEKENEPQFIENQCIHCKKVIREKPWIIVNVDCGYIYGCSYHCGTQLHNYIGTGYWKNVINKEDFSEPRPISSKKNKKDITTGFGMEEIRDEIEREELRIKMIEETFEEDDLSDEYSDEEFY